MKEVTRTLNNNKFRAIARGHRLLKSFSFQAVANRYRPLVYKARYISFEISIR